MNGELWQETMKIFVELIGNRHGIRRQKQALLFIDGCASHLREWTITNLGKENISALYFPSNSSHVLQPADGEVFANYKQTARTNLQSSALKASITGELEKEFTLLECIQSHTEAVTPSVVKAAFRNRGIWPWDPLHWPQYPPCLSHSPDPNGSLQRLFGISCSENGNRITEEVLYES
jgi:hypothetical protein